MDKERVKQKSGVSPFGGPLRLPGDSCPNGANPGLPLAFFGTGDHPRRARCFSGGQAGFHHARPVVAALPFSRGVRQTGHPALIGIDLYFSPRRCPAFLKCQGRTV